MRALNWHLHAPDSLRPRKLSELLSEPPEVDQQSTSKPPAVAHDFSQLPHSSDVLERVEATEAEALEQATGQPAAGQQGTVQLDKVGILSKHEQQRAPPHTLDHLRGVWDAGSGCGGGGGGDSLDNSSPTSSDLPQFPPASIDEPMFGRVLHAQDSDRARGELSLAQGALGAAFGSPSGPPSERGPSRKNDVGHPADGEEGMERMRASPVMCDKVYGMDGRTRHDRSDVYLAVSSSAQSSGVASHGGEGRSWGSGAPQSPSGDQQPCCSAKAALEVQGGTPLHTPPHTPPRKRTKAIGGAAVADGGDTVASGVSSTPDGVGVREGTTNESKSFGRNR